MKLVLSKDGVKREIQTPFALCCDMEELDRLIRAMQAARAGMTETGGTYGWLRIDTAHPDPDGPANTPPLKWTER